MTTAKKAPVRAGPVSTLTMYEATDAMLTVRRWIEDNAEAIIEAGGELPAELVELMDKADGDLNTKAERTAFFLRELSETQDALKRQAAVLTRKAKALERSEAGLKGYYLLQFIRLGYNRLEGKIGGLRVQRNSAASITVAEDFDAYDLVAAGKESWVRKIDPVPAQLQVDTWAVGEAFKAALTEARSEYDLRAAAGEVPAADTVCDAELYRLLSERACTIAGFPAGITAKIGATVRLI